MAAEEVAYAHDNRAEPDHLWATREDNIDEAFHAELAAVEDKEALDSDWAGFDDQLVKEREEWDMKEEVGGYHAVRGEQRLLYQATAHCSRATRARHHRHPGGFRSTR
jgi:hypothetical protein